MITLTEIHLIIAVICVFAIGILVGRVLFPKKDNDIEPCGVLHVETSDPDGPYLFLELDNEHTPERIMNEPKVIFFVDNKPYITTNEQREDEGLNPRK